MKLKKVLATVLAGALAVTAALKLPVTEAPGRLRFRAACIISSLSSIPAGHPSIIQPRAMPWLSPKLVTVKLSPNELPFFFINLIIIKTLVKLK